jgi:two-component system, NarL family, sensor kinase
MVYFRSMKKAISWILFWLVFCLYISQVSAQAKPQKYIDSLLAIANKVKADSNSINALTHLQRYYFERGLYDSTLKYALRALPIAKKLNINKNIARTHYNLGMSYTNLTQYDSAAANLTKALALMPLVRDTLMEINCYNAFAILSNYQSDYMTAVEYMTKAAAIIDHSHSLKIKQLLPQILGNIGHNLIAEKQIEKGVEYEKKTLLLKDYPNESRYRVLLYLDVFDAYVKLNQLTVAKSYLDSAIEQNRPLNNIAVSGIVANNEGFYYETIKDNDKALKSYLQSYQLCESIGNNYLKAQAGDNIAQLYFRTGNFSQIEKYAKEANIIGKQLKHYKVVASTYDVLKKNASRQGDFKNALAYAELYKIYTDSATNQETQKVTLSLESKYQNQKKEKEIAALTIANTQKELEVVKRNQLLVAGGIAASAALIILGLFYRNSRQKNLIAEQEKKYQQEQIKFLERQQQVVSLQSMVNGQETERTRIAKDLHDGLGGLFSTVKMYFSTLQHDTPTLKDNELFQKSYKLVDTASEEVRQIAHNMMPEVLMKLGLTNALKDLSDNISAGKLLKVSLETHGMNKRLNATTEIMLFRIVQELLNNIIKHANATEAIIQFIRENERLSVVVEDNGRGFNTQEADEQNHSGIATIQSRVSYLNGKMSIDSQKNVGTTVMMDFLINEPQASDTSKVS